MISKTCDSGLKVYAFLVMLFLFSTCPVYSDVSVVRTAPESVGFGEGIHVVVLVLNNGSESLDLTVRECLDSGMQLDYGVPEGAVEEVDLYIGVPSFVWSFSLPRGGRRILEYDIRPRGIGHYYAPPSLVYWAGGSVYSGSLMVRVECNLDGVCVTQEGEHFYNCPGDCPSGSEDGVCDLQPDGRCDPDCIQGDPDCDLYCGDGICAGLENKRNCPPDCLKEAGSSGTVPTSTTLPVGEMKESAGDSLSDIMWYAILVFLGLFLFYFMFRRR